ncbi:hypothetical protein [Paenibacillus sp. FSL P4-0184]|uniref:hypothetical protein n=1 Tax=Paenibacillus sp. FSL P4-0184 TaxID=2921632 RepID=UPI0030FC3D50
MGVNIISNATIVQTNDNIFIGSDSATSAMLDGQLYRIDEKATKLYQINNMVLFCSGNLDYCYNLVEEFLKQEVKNANVIKNLLKASYDGEKIDILLCEFKEGKTFVYQISPYNNFEIVCFTDIPVGAVNVLTAGMKTLESHSLAYENLLKRMTISKLYKSVFGSISYEGIGGTLSVYRLDENKVSEYLTHEIEEKTDLKILTIEVISNQFKTQMIVGERIYGKVFIGVNLALEDEEGVLKFQGSKGEIFDRNGRLVMKLGLVHEEPDTFGLWSFNDVTRVKVDQLEGFLIDKATTDIVKRPDGWEKVLWADPKDGTIYAKGLVAQNIKIVNNIGDTILDAENSYFDIGDFDTIVMDNKLTSMEKMQIITELYKINSGYHRTLEQAEEYKRSQCDDVFDMEAQFFSKTPSTIDLYSTTPLTQAYFALIIFLSTLKLCHQTH